MGSLAGPTLCKSMPNRRWASVRAWAPAAMACLGVFVAGIAPVSDGDLWWHLSAGREMVQTRGLLSVDPFSTSAGGRPWADVHWLFQLAVYAVYCLGGLSALVLVKCAAVGSGAALLVRTVGEQAGRRAAWLCAGLLIGTLFCARGLLLLRPTVLTLVFLAAFLLVLERFRRDRRASGLWPLPLLQVLWANCQGLSALGPVLVLAYLGGAVLASIVAGRRGRGPFADEGGLAAARALALTLALCLAASCVTPFGLRALGLPWQLLSRLSPHRANVFSSNIVENVPPLAAEVAGVFWHLKWYFGALALAFAVGRRRLVASHVLLVGAFAVLALIGNRNVLLLYWMVTPLAVLRFWPAVSRARAALRLRRMPLVHATVRAAAWAALALVLAIAGRAAFGEPSVGAPAPFRTPELSARILERESGQGTIFAADEWGGYLIWRLFPRYRPYIDTRLILRSADEFSEYLGVVDQPERFDDFQRGHHLDYVVLPVAYPDRYLGLIAYLHANAEWKLVFTDGQETLFARRDDPAFAALDAYDLSSSETTQHLLDDLERRYGPEPAIHDAARLKLASLEMALLQFAQAERVLVTVASAESDALRGRARLAAGDVSGAERIGQELLRRDAKDSNALDLMARVSLRLGQPRPALQFLRRALQADPYDPEAERILSSLEQHEASP